MRPGRAPWPAPVVAARVAAVLLVVVAAAVFAALRAGSAGGGPSLSEPPTPPEGLVAAMHESEATILTRGGGECALASDIEWAAQQNLVRLGMTRDWAVDLAAGVDPDSCVAYAILPDLKRIRLVQALPTSLKDALATVASRT